MANKMGVRVADKSLISEGEIICGCVDLSIEQFRMELNTHPSESFDELLARTGAGKSCAACLLDLENFFTSLPGRGGMPKENALFRKQSASKLTLKRRIYRILDCIGPQIPFPLEGVAPILIVAGIEQRLTVANHSLMFEGNKSAPPVIYAVSALAVGAVVSIGALLTGIARHRFGFVREWMVPRPGPLSDGETTRIVHFTRISDRPIRLVANLYCFAPWLILLPNGGWIYLGVMLVIGTSANFVWLAMLVTQANAVLRRRRQAIHMGETIKDHGQ